FLMSAHHAGQRTVITQSQSFVAQLGSTLDQLFGVRGPGQEGEVGNAVQLGVGAQKGKRRIHEMASDGWLGIMEVLRRTGRAETSLDPFSVRGKSSSGRPGRLPPRSSLGADGPGSSTNPFQCAPAPEPGVEAAPDGQAVPDELTRPWAVAATRKGGSSPPPARFWRPV